MCTCTQQEVVCARAQARVCARILGCVCMCVCVCVRVHVRERVRDCCLWWYVTSLGLFCNSLETAGAGAREQGLGRGCVRVLRLLLLLPPPPPPLLLLLLVKGAQSWAVSRCFLNLLKCVGRTSKGLGRGCVHWLLRVVGV